MPTEAEVQAARERVKNWDGRTGNINDDLDTIRAANQAKRAAAAAEQGVGSGGADAGDGGSGGSGSGQGGGGHGRGPAMPERSGHPAFDADRGGATMLARFIRNLLWWVWAAAVGFVLSYMVGLGQAPAWGAGLCRGLPGCAVLALHPVVSEGGRRWVSPLSGWMGERGPLTVRSVDEARVYRKFQCPGCGKPRPKSWRTLAQWLDKDGRPQEQHPLTGLPLPRVGLELARPGTG